MTYVNLFLQWRNKNINAIKEILSPDIQLIFVKSDNQSKTYNYRKIIDLLETYFYEFSDWDFEILKTYIRDDEKIVITTITMENLNTSVSEPTSFWILTFKNDKLIRCYIEKNLSNL